MDEVRRTAAIAQQARLVHGLMQIKVEDLASINLGQYQRLEYV